MDPIHSSPILPGATIGVYGSGQLGRMLAIAARELGYRVIVFSPDSDSPAGQVSDKEYTGDYHDLVGIRNFAREADVVTFEFENVPVASTAAAAEITPVRPGGNVLHTTQNRLREKKFLSAHGFPTTDFREIHSFSDLESAVRDLGLPGVLKTADFGYDGKGQRKLTNLNELVSIWEEFQGGETIYEAFIDFQKEVSVVAARTSAGEFQAFPFFENTHSNHILDITFAPAAIPPSLEEAASELAAGILEKLSVVGLLTVEMFVTRDGRLLVNELAPRTHNSGHLTIDACVTSQFEQQVRAVCGLPLGSTRLQQPAAMANLLGHLWMKGEPNWGAALEDPLVKLHLYGKAEPRVGRKMGHLTAIGGSTDEAVRRVESARSRL